jgi:hypothetical protein
MYNTGHIAHYNAEKTNVCYRSEKDRSRVMATTVTMTRGITYHTEVKEEVELSKITKEALADSVTSEGENFATRIAVGVQPAPPIAPPAKQ